MILEVKVFENMIPTDFFVFYALDILVPTYRFYKKNENKTTDILFLKDKKLRYFRQYICHG